MIKKWALVPYYEYYQGVQKSIHVSVKFWKLAKVGMGVNLAKVTIHLIYLFWLVYLWEKFGDCLYDIYFT